MGAAVLLYDHQQRFLGRVLTGDHGEFKLLGLLPARYSVKVLLVSFVPATKEILVLPGMRSVLNVNLSTLFSSIQFAYPAFESGNIMTDDWKWVLRSASSTRPVLRFIDPGTVSASATGSTTDTDPVSTTEHASVFSETRGLLRFSAGEGPLSDGAGTEADLGTTFALETSLYGNSLLQFAGNLGYGSATGVPTAAFRTSYKREIAGDTPEISITMRQMLMPGSVGAAVSGPDSSGLPMMRNLSASVDDQYKVTDNVTVQYGATMDSVTFVGHLNYYSPYARLKYTDDNSSFEVAYSSGNPRPNNSGEASPDGSLQSDGALQHDIDALGVFPRLSLLNGRTEIQRANEYEIVYARKAGSRTYSGSVYSQYVTNAGITMVAPSGFFAGNVLPDVFAGTSVFDVGNFQNNGYAGSVTQNLGSNASVTMIYSDNGALTADTRELVSNNPDELRSMIRTGRRHAITSRFSATVPHAGTRLISSYQWTGDSRAIMAGNLCAADSMQPLPGFNVYVRQPIPGFGRHVEATADIRNMLAQGYLPMSAVGGQRILLVQNPRSVRGGLSFTF